MENRVNSPIEPTAEDDSAIWRFIYNKKVREKSDEPIDSDFFKKFCEGGSVEFGEEQAYEYFINIMRSDLYKEQELKPHEILELYKVLKIELSPYQVETLERNFSVFLKLNTHRTLVSWSLPRQEAAKRAYEPETEEGDEDDVQNSEPRRKRRSSMKLERQDSGEGCSSSHDLPENLDSKEQAAQEIMDLLVGPVVKTEEAEDDVVDPEDVRILGEILKTDPDSDGEGDVTVEKVISGNAEVPEDIEQKMWEYIGANFEKDRPTRFKTVDFWTIFIAETISDNDTLTPLQLLNHFTKNLLPKLWNHPIRIANRLRILRGLRMPITKDQKKALEQEFKLRIHVDQLSCIEEWEPRKSYETPRRAPKTRIPSDSDEEESPPPPPMIPPRRASRTPNKKVKTPVIAKSAHSICKKPAPDPSTGKPRRAVFTPGDDESMWKFLLEEIRIGLKPEPKGLELWKRYIDETECWREPRNLNSHYRKIMTQNLHLVEMPLADKLELYMYTKIPCPTDQIQEFRKEYLINHKNRVITYGIERTDKGFDDEEEEADREEMRIEDSDEERDREEMKIEESEGEGDAPESRATSEIRKSSRTTRRPSKLRDSPESRAPSESSETHQSTKKPSRITRKPSKLADVPESTEAPESENQHQNNTRKSSRATRRPAKLADTSEAKNPEEDLLNAIDDAHNTGNINQDLYGLVQKVLGAAFEIDSTLGSEIIQDNQNVCEESAKNAEEIGE